MTPLAPLTPALPTDLQRWLSGAGMSWRVVAHPQAASAAAEAAALRRPAETVAKTVVVRVAGELACIAIPASERLAPQKLRSVLGTPAVALACEDEILRAAPTYQLGALPPVGPAVPPLTVLDRRLLTYGRVLCAAGDRTLSIAVDPEDLVRVSGAQVADVCLDRGRVRPAPAAAA